jgi:hypothetical protein
VKLFNNVLSDLLAERELRVDYTCRITEPAFNWNAARERDILVSIEFIN